MSPRGHTARSGTGARAGSLRWGAGHRPRRWGKTPRGPGGGGAGRRPRPAAQGPAWRLVTTGGLSGQGRTGVCSERDGEHLGQSAVNNLHPFWLLGGKQTLRVEAGRPGGAVVTLFPGTQHLKPAEFGSLHANGMTLGEGGC